ncbi:MAG: hypothetical protein AcusKO_50460 [Acuticoccus sp.]
MANKVVIFIVHGFPTRPAEFLRGDLQSAIAKMTPLAASVEDLGDVVFSDVLFGWTTGRRFNDIAREVLDELDAVVAEREPDEIILLGYSAGALLIRKVALLAEGYSDDAVSERTKDQRPWFGRLKRLVMLAGLNNGWQISSATPMWDRVGAPFWIALGSFLSWTKREMITAFQLRRGSAYISSIKLQTRAARQAADRDGMPRPEMVQLVGTRDDLVSPVDAVDPLHDDDIVYIELPGTDHAEAPSIDDRRTLDDGRPAGAVRLELIRRAIAKPLAALKAEDAIDLDYLADYLRFREPAVGEPAPAKPLDHVVFVVHGIRDNGFWTARIAARIHQRARPKGLNVEVVTPTYGYLAAIPFIIAPWRNEKVNWFRDQYVRTRFRYGDEPKYSFIGHSNGTYLLAGAMADCPQVVFDNAVLAGSVVDKDHDWTVKTKNFVADGDTWVSALAYVLRPLSSLVPGRTTSPALGGGGVLGFADEDVHNAMYLIGDHGSGITEQRWDNIAAAVLESADLDRDQPRPSSSKLKMMAQSWGLLAGIVAGAVFILSAPLWLLWLGLPPWLMAFAFVGLVAFVWRVGNHM